MKITNIFFFVFIFATSLGTIKSAKAQNGDQILDGIGETALSARYIFNGDVKDWSRNNLHGLATQINFINDERFGKVLSLSGGDQSFVSIPGKMIPNMESFSISGWFYFRSTKIGQSLFSYGKNNANRIAAITSGNAMPLGLKVLFPSKNLNAIEDHTVSLKLNQWVHLAIVFDISSKTISTFVDGKVAASTKFLPADVYTLLNSETRNNFIIGKSSEAGDGNLVANIHDFRIYRIGLNDKQVASSSGNSNTLTNGNQVNTKVKLEDDFPKFSPSTPQLYNKYLIKVADVDVSTTIGTSPRLPSHLKATYQKGIKKADVRVLWPTPMDNSVVLKSGRYSVTGSIPGTDFKPKANVIVKENMDEVLPQPKLKSFPLNKVTLSNDAHGQKTKFIENRDKFLTVLAQTDPNSFLFMFRQAYGQKQPESAHPLGGWDTEDTKLRGHATGHYLSAIAQAYSSTGYDKALQANFQKKITYMVNTLYELAQLSGKPVKGSRVYQSNPQAIPMGPGKTAFDSDLSTAGIRNDYWNWGVGFISAYPPDQFIMLENGAKYGGQKNQIWAPYYTLHKILAGLIDIYKATGNKKALSVAVNMGGWVFKRLNNLPQEQLIKMWNTYIAGEYGGMNESMARLYEITKNPDFLKTAKLFDNIKVFYGDRMHSDGLAKNVDVFRGLHANQHIPQIVGSIEMYQASKDADYYKIADNFWHKMIDDYSYSIGGVAGARNPSNAECFVAQPSSLYANGFSPEGQNETCATYNMLKLTGDLFRFDQRGELMDYYERGLYNHILASVAEHSPANTYHVPLNPGAIKQFDNGDMTGFTCCNGTAIESNTKLQNSIYFKSSDNESLYVNLYIPSILNWSERKIVIKQTTDFPKSDETKLTVNGSGKFAVNIRVPSWATNGFIIKINGKVQNDEAIPGSYLHLNRIWKDGDVIEVKMPFSFRLDPVMDQQNIASLFYGPILLAAQETEARKEWRKITLDAVDISKSIKGEPKKLLFDIDGVPFKPFYDSYGRHSVYLDVTLK
ncbi:MAG: hypothetical protein EOO95_02625 [Pedobacter sp.]|nr:MAG: hypothetical protein EOO95_02625 [Pedobacter sp.]